jgi:hypothetical protein
MALKLDPQQLGERGDAGGDFAGRGGQPLPQSLRHQMEASFASDFSGVRIHQGHQATHVGALAYSQGEDIHFAPGCYDPTSVTGQKLIGHELAHVVQQRAGRTIPDVPRGMVAVDESLEPEADLPGERAVPER